MKVATALAVLGIGVLGAALFLRPRRATGVSETPAGEAPSVQQGEVWKPQLGESLTASREEEAQGGRDVATAPDEGSQTEEGGNSDPKHRAYIEARVAELGELSGKDDSSSLAILLSEVRNPEKEIREAALDAIVQSGNRDAISRLVELASQAEDAGEKRAIMEAADFLKLPTITEMVRQKRGARNTGSAR